MKKFIFSIGLGIFAGVIDVVPMLLQRLDPYANASAFAQWVVLGIIISYCQFTVKGWLKGLIIAEAAAVPIMILVAKTELFSIVPIFVMSAILGSFVGWAGERYTK